MKDCNNCKHEDCWEYAEPCSSCAGMTGEPTNWEPQHNYDRIINKTPEELAEFLIQDGACPPERMYPDSCPNCYRVTPKVCCDCWLDWLKQEAEESE